MTQVKRGLGALKEAADNQQAFVGYLKLKAGESKLIRIAEHPDNLVSVYEHFIETPAASRTFTCLGDGCPACAAGLKKSFAAYIPVLDVAADKILVFKAGVTVGAQILGLFNEYPDLLHREIKITREGEKLKTKYYFYPKDNVPKDLSSYERPDVDAAAEPRTADEMRNFMMGMVSAPASGGSSAGSEQSAPPAAPAPKGDYPF